MAYVKSPCYKCADKVISPNCHDAERCSKWAKYLEEKSEFDKKVKREKDANAVGMDSHLRIQNHFYKRVGKFR